MNLTVTGRYTAKDQLKADKANKFIGRGSSRSSTNSYKNDYGENANCGVYTSDDVVFVSAEGNRPGRHTPDFDELSLAIKAGVTFITDDISNRRRAYNTGEREVARFLLQNGYHDNNDGVWNESITRILV